MDYADIRDLPPMIPTITQDNYGLLRAMQRRDVIENRAAKRKAFIARLSRGLQSIVTNPVLRGNRRGVVSNASWFARLAEAGRREVRDPVPQGREREGTSSPGKLDVQRRELAVHKL